MLCPALLSKVISLRHLGVLAMRNPLFSSMQKRPICSYCHAKSRLLPSIFFDKNFALMRDASFDFLQALLETPSPSGFETRGQNLWASYAGQFADKVESDTYGNVFAELNVGGISEDCDRRAF